MKQTLIKLARQIESKRYGKYRGFVADNQDPRKLGRLKVRVPSVFRDEVVGWALPCMPYGGVAQQGLFMIPEVDAQIWVEFEEGDISRPVWVGTFWQQEGDIPDEAAKTEPTTRMLKTKSGHILQFDDEAGAERFYLHHPAGADMEIDQNGTIALTDAGGSKLSMDADAGEIVIEDVNGNTMTMRSSGTTIEDSNGNKIDMAASGITIKGTQIVVEGSQVMLGGQGGEPVIKGSSFLSMFATHIHPTTAPGAPTAPPVPQGEMSTLSTKVTSA